MNFTHSFRRPDLFSANAAGLVCIALLPILLLIYGIPEIGRVWVGAIALFHFVVLLLVGLFSPRVRCEWSGGPIQLLGVLVTVGLFLCCYFLALSSGIDPRRSEWIRFVVIGIPLATVDVLVGAHVIQTLRSLCLSGTYRGAVVDYMGKDAQCGTTPTNPPPGA